jgi:DNA-binding response OmpR family regulator
MTFTHEPPLRGARILVAEDDAILAFDIMDLLRKAGAEVLGPAATLADALALAGLAALSCAVLDVNLRHELVFPAAQRLKECGVPIIFHTSHSEPERLRQDWPGAVVLTKPAPHKLLIRAVCEAFRGVGFCAGMGCRYCS